MRRKHVPYHQQVKIIFCQCIKGEWSQKERLIAPLLFSITMLLICHMIFVEFSSEKAVPLFIAEVFLVLLLSSQVSLLKQFDIEQKDQVYTILRVSPIKSSAWFLAKYFVIFLLSGLILLPTVFLAGLFQLSQGQFSLLGGDFFLIALLSLSSLSALGSLLSALVSNSSGKEILFPLLYYPLSCPILLGGVEGANVLQHVEKSFESAFFLNWLMMLVGLNIIFLTLGLLLFDELVTS